MVITITIDDKIALRTGHEILHMLYHLLKSKSPSYTIFDTNEVLKLTKEKLFIVGKEECCNTKTTLTLPPNLVYNWVHLENC